MGREAGPCGAGPSIVHVVLGPTGPGCQPKHDTPRRALSAQPSIMSFVGWANSSVPWAYPASTTHLCISTLARPHRSISFTDPHALPLIETSEPPPPRLPTIVLPVSTPSTPPTWIVVRASLRSAPRLRSSPLSTTCCRPCLSVSTTFFLDARYICSFPFMLE